MALVPGTRLGPYEIISAIGAGGPPALATENHRRELRRGLAEAQQRPW